MIKKNINLENCLSDLVYLFNPNKKYEFIYNTIYT